MNNHAEFGVAVDHECIRYPSDGYTVVASAPP
jgi:hypothetical protein